MKSSCWIFNGTLKHDGYGREVGDELAHRYSYRTYVGNIPSGMLICHRCDNPSCVRPDHLFLGTAKDNVQDMMSKGRNKYKSFAGEQHWKAKLSDKHVAFIRHTRLDKRRFTMSAKALAEMFNVTINHIHKIREGNAWEAKGD